MAENVPKEKEYSTPVKKGKGPQSVTLLRKAGCACHSPILEG